VNYVVLNWLNVLVFHERVQCIHTVGEGNHARLVLLVAHAECNHWRREEGIKGLKKK
jgi:hypothetical protein